MIWKVESHVDGHVRAVPATFSKAPYYLEEVQNLRIRRDHIVFDYHKEILGPFRVPGLCPTMWSEMRRRSVGSDLEQKVRRWMNG